MSTGIGTWRLIKHELIAYEALANAWGAKHGEINSMASVERFYAVHPPKRFQVAADVFYVTYRWLGRRGVGIEYGRGGWTQFDLDTMVCVYSD